MGTRVKSQSAYLRAIGQSPSASDRRVAPIQRTAKRVQLVGAKGAEKQMIRKNVAVLKAAFDPNDTMAKARSREVQQRMKEYRGAKVVDKVERKRKK